MIGKYIVNSKINDFKWEHHNIAFLIIFIIKLYVFQEDLLQVQAYGKHCSLLTLCNVYF